jgi:hypothetical protein
MIKATLAQLALPALLLLLLLNLAPARASSPTDVVPDGSGLYDAAALLAQEHLLPIGAPDATALLNVTHRLYTRGEMARWIAGVQTTPPDARGAAALAFARNILAPELGSESGDGPRHSASLGETAILMPEIAAQSDHGSNLGNRGYVFGRGRLFGTLGRDGAYTVSVTNLYRETRDHLSYTTADGGTAGGDDPGVLEGVDEAYATVLGAHGIRATAGLIRQDWGPGYLGDMMVDANAPAHPTIQVELPFYLGRYLGSYRFTQYESTYRNDGQTIYQGARRLEHRFGDRVSLDLEERYNAPNLDQPVVLFLPYYAYQQHDIRGAIEPTVFNYFSAIGLTIQPSGPRTDSRLYGELGIDDVKAPFGLGAGNNTPQKLGYLVGYAQAFLETGTDAVVELSHEDRATYTDATAPALAWFSSNLVQGYPTGPNGTEIYARVGQRFAKKFTAAVDYDDRRRGVDDLPAPDWQSVDVSVSYRLQTTESVGLSYSDYREDAYNGSLPPGNPGAAGGAAVGENLHRHLLALSFLQMF